LGGDWKGIRRVKNLGILSAQVLFQKKMEEKPRENELTQVHLENGH